MDFRMHRWPFSTHHGTNSYGYSILVLTLLVKFVTFPLTKKQIEGSVNMQALQPKVKELQAMVRKRPEVADGNGETM